MRGAVPWFVSLTLLAFMTISPVTFPAQAAGAAASGGAYVPLTPSRLLDTRSALGGHTPAAGGTVHLPVLDQDGIPSTGVAAVALTVTAVGPSAGGYVTVYPDGAARPATSNLNFAAGQTIANQATVAVGSDGAIALYNGGRGKTPLLADITGYYTGSPPTALTFGTTTVADPVQGGLVSLSCAGPGDCLAGDLNGNVVTLGGQSASRATALTSFVGPVSSLSCPSATFCAATDGPNLEFRTGSTWANSGAPAPTSDWNLVSCTSSDFCVAIDDTAQVAVYTGSWSPLGGTISSNGVVALSCATPTFCVAVDPSGDAITFDGSTWTTTSHVLSGGGPATVSCADEATCLAGQGDETAYFDGTNWATSTDPNAEPVNSVACPDVSTCIALYDDGTTRILRSGTSWTAGPTAPATGLLDCVSDTDCVALTNASHGPDSYSSQFDGMSWSPLALAETETGGRLVSMSCPTVDFCGATDVGGIAETYDGTTWSDPVRIDPTFSATAISCPQAGFCLAVTPSSDAVIYSNGSWGAPMSTGYSGLSSVSCASTTLCVAIDNQGSAYTWRGSTWTATTIDPNDDLSSVDCPTVEYCLAGDLSGEVLTDVAGSWSRPTPIRGTTAIEAVSCASAEFCILGDEHGLVAFYNGHTWSSPLTIPGLTSIAAVSCGDDECGVVNYQSFVVINQGGVATTEGQQVLRPSALACAGTLTCRVSGARGTLATGTT